MDISKFFYELDSMYTNGSQTSEIENYLTGSLMQAENEGDIASAIAVCNEAGGFFRVKGEFTKGEEILCKALRYISDLGMTGTPGHATTLLNLATLLTHKGDIAKAAYIFENSSEIIERCGDSHSYTAAALQNNIASLNLRMGNYSKGLEHAEKALFLLEGIPNKGDERGVTHTIEAQIMLKKDDIPLAIEQLRLAREEFDSDNESSPIHRAAMEHCLAEALLESRELSEAIFACERGIKLLETSPIRVPALEAIKQLKDFCLKEIEQQSKSEILQ